MRIYGAPSSSTVNNSTYPYGNQSLGRAHLASGQYAQIASGATQTLIDTSVNNPNTPGYIDHIWIGTLASISYLAHQESVVKVYLDGSATPDITFHWGGPTIAVNFGANGASWDGGRAGLVTNGPADGDGFIKIKIPFDKSIKITFTNADTGTVKFFWDISYKLTASTPIDWGRAKRLQISELWQQTVTPYSNVVLANVTGRGLIYGWTFLAKAGDANFNFLEGDPQIKIDGESTASLVWSGTEDYFLNGFYFGGGKLLAEDHGAAFVNTSNHTFGVYRWHLEDPIPFETGFEFIWPVGDASEATVTTGPQIWSEVFYYLDS